MKTYLVTIPIAGHIVFEVEAANEEEAETKAWDKDPTEGELSWDMLTRFNQGNVCYCPNPWEQTIEEI